MADFPGLPFDEVPAPAAPLSVSALTAQLRDLVEMAFSRVLVEGELSSCKLWSSGHLYFTLKDSGAQVRAVMFRGNVRTLKFKPEEGMHVVARGRISVYDAKGEYQIICDAIEPHGLGARQAAFDQLKRTLQREGLFEASRKRPLPVLPRRIAIVTSLDGAAIRDVLRILITRHPTVRVVVRAARVQGDGAAADLVRGLQAVCRIPEVDVVIVGRGGGSAEDLWAFNDEALARAIVACPVPVIAAVGHETDFTIADFVADVRASTPSNAAELVVDRADNFLARIDRADRRLRAAVTMALTRRRQRAERAGARLGQWPGVLVLRDRDRGELAHRLERAARAALGVRQGRFLDLRRRLEARDLRRVAATFRTRLVGADARLTAAMTTRRADAAARAGALSGRLHALSPLAVLGRGYAVCWNGTGDGIIRSSRDVRPGDGVRVTLADGELDCRVERSTPARTDV